MTSYGSSVKYFPVFKYNLEGFYIKSLARNFAATDYSVSHKLIFQLYWLYVKVVRVVFLQMDLPKSFVVDVWPSTLCGPVEALENKIWPTKYVVSTFGIFF